MVIEDLYTYEVRSHVDHTIEAAISINENSTLYKGHFPGFPVTPGVCQVLMVKEILEGVLRFPLILKAAGNIKFTAVHDPFAVRKIEAKISYTPEGNRFRTVATLYQGELIYLKFKGEFEKR